jgi:hypothetical protein
MTELPRLARLLWVTAASVVMAFGLSAPVAAKPMGPCEDVTYVGVCVPIGERDSTPPRQGHPDAPIVPQGSGGLFG